ncbi:uncharacterized protein TNCV_3603331 [Trichonephila clavipes]|nr:uncharacterized protein TNCV_3603331 [Trichonephila clavipes]
MPWTRLTLLPGAGAGWLCLLFECTLAVGKDATNCDGEVLAVCEATIAELKLRRLSHKAGLRPYSGSQVMLGHERTDQKAKQEAEVTQTEVLLTLRRAKSIISTYIDKYTAMTQKTKRLESHGKVWPLWANPKALERAKAVALFRLTTGHKFLGVYLHCLGVAAYEA